MAPSIVFIHYSGQSLPEGESRSAIRSQAMKVAHAQRRQRKADASQQSQMLGAPRIANIPRVPTTSSPEEDESAVTTEEKAQFDRWRERLSATNVAVVTMTNSAATQRTVSSRYYLKIANVSTFCPFIHTVHVLRINWMHKLISW